jgi:hypothetical protein
MGGKRNSYRLLVGKPEGKRPPKRPRPKGEYNIKINVKEVGLQGVDCIHLDQGTDKWQDLVKVAMSLRVTYTEETFLDQLRN